jgi:hypothetical protein
VAHEEVDRGQGEATSVFSRSVSVIDCDCKAACRVSRAMPCVRGCSRLGYYCNGSHAR